MSPADEEFEVWGGRFSKRELFGRARELAFWPVVVLGPALFMLFAMDKFPFLDENAALLWIVPFPVLVIAWGLCIVFRKKLFPWGQKASALMWAGTLAVAVLPAMLLLGAVIFVNGALDGSAPVEYRAEVRGRSNKKQSVTVAVASFPKLRVSVQLMREEFDNIGRGDTLSLFVRSGALGVPWIERYSLP
jgi:hypothetical protein